MIIKIFRKISFWIHRKRIREIVDYIEGSSPEEIFLQKLRNRRIYQKLYCRASWDSTSSLLVDRKLVEGDLSNLSRIEKVGLQSRLCCILDYYSVEYSVGVPDLALWRKWERFIPSYLGLSLELMDELESIDPKREHTKKWHAERFREAYPCEKYSPRWLQNCEWPKDDDGSNCLFLYQTGFPNHHDFIEYHFKKANGEEIVIEQYI